MLQKFPMLATTQPDPIIDEKRCALTFESSIVSRTSRSTLTIAIIYHFLLCCTQQQIMG
jgi:hypothetical protein